MTLIVSVPLAMLCITTIVHIYISSGWQWPINPNHVSLWSFQRVPFVMSDIFNTTSPVSV